MYGLRCIDNFHPVIFYPFFIPFLFSTVTYFDKHIVRGRVQTGVDPLSRNIPPTQYVYDTYLPIPMTYPIPFVNFHKIFNLYT